MAHSLSPVSLSGSPPCGLRPPAALPLCPACPQPSLETGACGYWGGPSSVPSKAYLHPTSPVNVALFGTGVLACVIQLRPWIQSGPQIQAGVWDGEVWKGAACHGPSITYQLFFFSCIGCHILENFFFILLRDTWYFTKHIILYRRNSFSLPVNVISFPWNFTFCFTNVYQIMFLIGILF